MIKQWTIDPLLPLVGTWTGTGTAVYPGRDTAQYREQCVFEVDERRGLLHYEQKAWVDDLILAWESGFIRPLADGQVDLINAQNNGRVEVMQGTLTTTDVGLDILLHSVLYGNDDKMIEAQREIQVQGENLHYTVWTLTHVQPTMFLHLDAQLKKERS